MKRKFYLITAIIIFIGGISFSFKATETVQCAFLKVDYPGGGAVGAGQGLTGASWDNSGRTCSRCHSGGSYGATTALTLLSGSTPVTQYTPGAAYTLQLKITCTSGSPRYGYCLMAAKSTAHTDINTWGTMPTGAQKNTVSSRHYIEQTSARTATSTSPTSSYTLSVPWTAPAVGTGSVSFYASGMAVNGTGGTGGDNPTSGVNITVTESATTPISFSTVTAQFNKNTVEVAWSTESEVSTNYFAVEQSSDGIHFVSKGTVAAQNNSSRTQYSFVDNNPSKGKNFYRIVAVDLSSSKLISKTVEVLSKSNGITLSPNPVHHNLFVSGLDAKGNSYKIINFNGQRVASGKLESNEVNTYSLAPGTYTLVITDQSGATQIKKFVKE